MAKKITKKSITKKLNKKIKKARKNKTFNIIYILVIIALAVAVYFYLNMPSEPANHSYSSEQNTEGFYYYNPEQSNGYYYDANGLVDQALKNALNTISNETFVPVNYEAAKTVLAASDLNKDNPSKMWGIYLGNEINPLWDAGATWDREHVWPNSRLGIPRVAKTTKNQGTDLHNLRAVNGAINSTRSNHPFVDGQGDAKLTEGGFYPGDDHKGDVARILFYMATMYDFLKLADDGFDEGQTYTETMVTMGKLSLLLEWHKQDPVDLFEQQRNQVIFDAQGNRNPYIDKPEYVHLIWENKTIVDLTKQVTTSFRPVLLMQLTYDLFNN